MSQRLRLQGKHSGKSRDAGCRSETPAVSGSRWRCCPGDFPQKECPCLRPEGSRNWDYSGKMSKCTGLAEVQEIRDVARSAEGLTVTVLALCRLSQKSKNPAE